MTALRSLRARMALTIACVGALVSIGIGVTVYELSVSDRFARARSELATRVTLAAEIARRSGSPVPGATRDDPLAPARLRAAVRGGQLATDRRGAVLWAGTPLAAGHGIYLRQSLDGDLAALRTLRDDLVLVGAAATLAAALLGAVLAATLSRRLVHAADTADTIAAGDLSARVTATGGDEIARLGTAIDGMAGALSARLQREQRFSADVAHELRTPLTALVSAAALLDEARPAAIVRERVGALRALVEDLLEIARLDAGAEAVQRDEVDLAALARRVAAEASDAAGAAGAAGASNGSADRDDPADGVVAVTVARAATAVTDARRVERILANLLANARRHGAPPYELTVDGDRISVRDHGPGYPAELLRDGPRPFASGGDARAGGTGLGLVIARAQAAAIGARLALANGDDGGAHATLTL